eukprot:snap_masked-scaffold_14-processed-gene-11.23-mRNA-1 protein AED:1.00 eAED:1.00 QI:0/0/0/0/1/1/3/0/76
MKLAKHMIFYVENRWLGKEFGEVFIVEANFLVASAQMSFYWEKDHFYAEISCTRAPYGNQSMKLATDVILYGKMAI